jgi:hypothetical protein
MMLCYCRFVDDDPAAQLRISKRTGILREARVEFVIFLIC